MNVDQQDNENQIQKMEEEKVIDEIQNSHLINQSDDQIQKQDQSMKESIEKKESQDKTNKQMTININSSDIKNEMSIQEVNQNLYSNRTNRMMLDIDNLSDIAKKDLVNDNISVHELE